MKILLHIFICYGRELYYGEDKFIFLSILGKRIA